MFYPEESLKRGGRFYLCWVADSWPLRFATITHRQLWSQDIRKICDDLLKVMINESGRPANRFSLRLSSQLLRGLVRLYQKKVTVFLSELCMINANVIKHTNKKWNVCELTLEDQVHPRLQQIQPLPLATIQEVPEVENEGRFEEIIANSSNVVTNIQDITLREATIPDIQVPLNDGFGEEHPEVLYQSVAERTLEVMLQAEGSVHSSALGTALDTTEPSRKSRLLPEAQMESISEQDLTMFRKSIAGEELLPVADFEKDIPVTPQPDQPAPPEMPVEIPQIIEPIAGPSREPITETPKTSAPVDTEFEELEELEPQLKRRRLRQRLIIDKKIKLSSEYLRSRIDDNFVELRCEASRDDVIAIRIPPLEYLRRPCHGGGSVRVSNIACDISRLFIRNLGIIPCKPLAERELEAVMDRPRCTRKRSVHDKSDEVEEAPIPQEAPQVIEVQMEQPSELNISKDIVLDRVSAVEREQDISDLPTQKILTISQAKRQAEDREVTGSPKRPRLVGQQSFRKSRLTQGEPPVEIQFPITETDKENIPYDDNIQTQIKETQRSVTAMLQEAGLADIQTHVEVEQHSASVYNKPVRRAPSEGSETPLGSLDRTKVSLGESDQTTDSRRLIREQWGTEGTMIKILTCIRDGLKPLTVRNLITKGPVLSGYQRMIAAQSFTSILKLKHHGFIRVRKHPDTLEIRDIILGPKFD